MRRIPRHRLETMTLADSFSRQPPHQQSAPAHQEQQRPPPSRFCIGSAHSCMHRVFQDDDQVSVCSQRRLHRARWPSCLQVPAARVIRRSAIFTPSNAFRSGCCREEAALQRCGNSHRNLIESCTLFTAHASQNSRTWFSSTQFGIKICDSKTHTNTFQNSLNVRKEMPTLIARGKLEADIDYQFFPNGRGESRIYL